MAIKCGRDGIFPQELDFLPALVHHPDPHVRILCDFSFFVMLVGVELDQGIGKPGAGQWRNPVFRQPVSLIGRVENPVFPGPDFHRNFFLDDMDRVGEILIRQ